MYRRISCPRCFCPQKLQTNPQTGQSRYMCSAAAVIPGWRNRRKAMDTRKITSLAQALLMFVLIPLPGISGKILNTSPPEPLSPGPFPVGVTTTVFVDNSRTDNLTKQPRTLVTEIWYPAAPMGDEARQMPKNK